MAMIKKAYDAIPRASVISNPYTYQPSTPEPTIHRHVSTIALMRPARRIMCSANARFIDITLASAIRTYTVTSDASDSTWRIAAPAVTAAIANSRGNKRSVFVNETRTDCQYDQVKMLDICVPSCNERYSKLRKLQLQWSRCRLMPHERNDNIVFDYDKCVCTVRLRKRTNSRSQCQLCDAIG